MLGSIKSNCGAMGTPYTGIGSCPKKEGKVSALLITGKNALYPMESEISCRACRGMSPRPMR